MKIAIVGPSPVPFTIGGVENLLWGLCDTINQKTPHQAELIKLPLRELSFWDLIESYRMFYHLDLSHFDAVIATKYPSWMVRHPNKICYMIHTLRGLYDTYHMTGLPEEPEGGVPEVDHVLDYMQKNPTPQSLEPFFSMLDELKHKEIPHTFFSFPGPLIRKIIHYLDHAGMAIDVRSYSSISDTVKNRRDYYPAGSNVKTIYPPSTQREFSEGAYRHIFLVSRLDAPKRIDMLIRAMACVKSDIKLFIAGTGPEGDRLKAMAEGDPRIEFLGFVNDETVDRYYADSLAVPFFPYDEDYGLITVEAMMHKKAVITTVDAGGPNEFVTDYETGFVTEFEEKAIAEKIDYMAQHPDEAERMGKRAYERVKGITWENTAEQLLAEFDRTKKETGRKKITVTSTFGIYPPRGGGQARIYHLYRELGKAIDVDIVSFGTVDDAAGDNRLAYGLREIRVPKTKEHQRMESRMDEKAGQSVTDIAMITLSGKTPEYGRRLAESIRTSDAVVVSHPYLYREVKKYLEGKPFLYEAHNVESLIKKEILPACPETEEMLQQVFDVEKECCENSRLILACSEEDRKTLASLYHIPEDKIIVVPNGVDCSLTPFTPMADRLENKRQAGLEDEKIGIFMGSWHGPNLEAAEKIISIAAECPEAKFILMGSQCSYFNDRQLPQNVGLLGIVPEEVKNRVFSLVDFAMNPMLSGSGTNLKMFDYMAAGMPVITTAFGARGIGRKDLVTEAEIEEMPDAIRRFQAKSMADQVEAARSYVEETFDWGRISRGYLERLQALMD